MQLITGKFHQNPLKNVEGVAETRTSVDKMAKTDNSSHINIDPKPYAKHQNPSSGS